MRLTSQPSVFKRAQARRNVAKKLGPLADCLRRWCGDAYRRRKRRDCCRNLNEGLMDVCAPLSNDHADLVRNLGHGSFTLHHTTGDKFTTGPITARPWK